MRRLHVHLGVADLDQSIAFYSALFGAAPTRQEADYAKWQLDAPLVNFAISAGKEGLSHLGIETDSDADLEALMARGQAAASDTVEEKNTTCCYARSDKLWAKSPGGIDWELFKTHEAVPAKPAADEAPACTGKTCCPA